MRGRPTDHAGKRYGRLLAVECVGKREGYHELFWRCRCDCGRYAVKRGYELSRGHTRSCGCLAKDVARLKLAERRQPKPERLVWGPDGATYPSLAAAARSFNVSAKTLAALIRLRDLDGNSLLGWRRAAVATAPGGA